MAAPTPTKGRRVSSGNDPAFGPATKSDQAHFKATARAREAEHDAAYQAGIDGGPQPDDAELLESYNVGAASRDEPADPTTPKAKPPRPAAAKKSGPLLNLPKSRPLTNVDPVNDGAGLLLGFLVYIIGINYLRGGAAGVKGWLSAKFINKPITTAAGGLTVPGGSTGSIVGPTPPGGVGPTGLPAVPPTPPVPGSPPFKGLGPLPDPSKSVGL